MARKRRKAFPLITRYVIPELTNHCNFRCIYCPHSVYRKNSEGGNQFNREKGYMSEELFNLVMENAAKYAQWVCIGFFGEPLLHQNFQRFVESIPANRCYRLVLNTNWSLATKENMSTMKRFDLVAISLDASYSDLWEKLCPGSPVLTLNGVPSRDRYDVIVEKIQYWLSLPDHAPTQLVYVVSSVNEHNKNRFVKEWRPRLGPRDHILTKTILSYGGVVKDSHMSNNDCIVTREIRSNVAWNGDVTPCNLDVNIEMKVGNLLEARDLERIWEGDEYKQMMSKMRRKEGICSNCFDANNRTEDEFYWSRKIYHLRRFIRSRGRNRWREQAPR